MKTNKKLFCAVAMMLGLQTMNVVSAQTDSYRLLHDNPYSYKKLIINFNLLQLELGQPTTFRVGLGSEYNVTKGLLVHADYDMTPLSLFGDEAIKKNQTSIEAGAYFAFSSRVKKDAKMKFEFNHSHQKYRMKLKASVLKQYCLHGGFASFSTPRSHNDYISFSSAQMVYGGLAVIRTKSALVSVDGYGTYDRESRGKFYIDALFAPVLTLQDNTNYAAYNGSASTATAATFPDLVKSRMGVRMGYMKRVNKPIGFYQGFETGIRPAVGNGFYFLLKVAISVGFIEGKTKEQE